MMGYGPRVGTKLMVAAAQGDHDKIRSLIGKGADVNARDRDGDSVLYYAASNGRATTVELLFSLGALPNPPKPADHISALVAAAMVACGLEAGAPRRDRTDYAATVRALLRGGADPDDLYREGFAMAIFNQNENIMLRRDQVRSCIEEPELRVVYLVDENLRKSFGI